MRLTLITVLPDLFVDMNPNNAGTTPYIDHNGQATRTHGAALEQSTNGSLWVGDLSLALYHADDGPSGSGSAVGDESRVNRRDGSSCRFVMGMVAT